MNIIIITIRNYKVYRELFTTKKRVGNDPLFI